MDLIQPLVELAKNHPHQFLAALAIIFLADKILTYSWEGFKWVSSRLYWQNKAFEHMAVIVENQKLMAAASEATAKSQENISRSQERLGTTVLSVAKVMESMLSKLEFKLDEAQQDACSNFSPRKHQ
jgi:hypothetical protein